MSTRHAVRVIGSKHDYIRRYKVIDPTGRRVDGVPGGLVEDEARDLAEELDAAADRAAVRSAARPRAYALVVGEYEEETVLGVHITDDPADAQALADHMTLMRARTAEENTYGVDSIPRDLIAVRAEPMPLLDHNGAAIERPVRLEIVR